MAKKKPVSARVPVSSPTPGMPVMVMVEPSMFQVSSSVGGIKLGWLPGLVNILTLAAPVPL
jgi:hypothetical protein